MNRRLMWEEDDKRTYREATPAEIVHALSTESLRKILEDQIEHLQKNLAELECDNSKVFYDEVGFPYHSRTYIASGTSSLI